MPYPKTSPASSVRIGTDWLVLSAFVLVIVFLWQVTYISWPPVPGNNPEYPIGWWGWFDQGNYLRGARALLEGNFSPSEHYYPPLYPLIGAAFIGLFPQHAYYFVDLFATVGFFLLFVATTRRHIGFWPAAIIGFTFIAPINMIRLQWVIPWTSTVSAVLVGASFLLFDRFERARRHGFWGMRTHVAVAFLFGLMCGLQLPLRPGDIVLMAPVALAYAVLVGIDLVRGGEDGQRRKAVGAAIAGILGLVPGAAIMSGFNLLAFGDLLGGYFALSVSRGFYFADFGEKLFSLVVASHPLYVERGADWLTELPINALCLGFLPAAVLFARPLLFRLVAIAALLQIFLYFSYGDAIPPGTFRYWNIHYFKWMLPWIVALAAYFVYHALTAGSGHRRQAVAGLATGVAATLLLFSVNVDPLPRPVSSLEGGGEGPVVLHFPEGPAIDYIDFDGTPGGWNEVYFDNRATIRADGGEPLENYSEYRMLPRGGDGIRLLFIRPLDAETVSVDFGTALTREAPLAAGDVHAASAEFGLDWPFASHWR
ncbi:hypothetical protein [Amorphus orientalis]|uniref:Uncharacterized protein n=1 Tax=Amorphus orientalis TaxID=649198 RepID=A0AAE3VQ14_9HYPH|nr:hypothetical protein [Amorphus orientalis]MDQ0316189.1 hypothetical protein [Amorphus orientalis]